MFVFFLQGSYPPAPSVLLQAPSTQPEVPNGEVKVKRKCGRPRNPIPRHKRVSHINAEHRRRGKIQVIGECLSEGVSEGESVSEGVIE